MAKYWWGDGWTDGQTERAAIQITIFSLIETCYGKINDLRELIMTPLIAVKIVMATKLHFRQMKSVLDMSLYYTPENRNFDLFRFS